MDVCQRGMLIAALCVYLTNVGVGLAAQFAGYHFGRWHHGLYAACCACALGASLWDFRWGLVATLVALAIFPFAKPRTPWHPALAVVGLAGYVAALVWP